MSSPCRLPGPRTARTLLLVALLAAARPCAGGEESVAGAAPASIPVHAALRPLRPWLAHEDWTIRSFAAYELRLRSEPGAILLATQMLSGEKHAYAAACALEALRGRPRHELLIEGGADLVDVLLRLGRHAHPTVSAHAREVLAKLPPVRLGAGTELRIYEGWWKRGRNALIRERRTLLAARAAQARRSPAPGGRGESTSAAPKVGERFYGRLELMRKHGLELCIVLDHTGSMRPVISAAKRRAVRLIRHLRAYLPQFRAGLVTYDDAARLRVPLTQDEQALAKGFRKVGAGGGGDWEEGVDKGIRLALRQDRLGWSQRAYRVVVVVGDAPPHDADVPGLLRGLQKARGDVLYDHAVVVHTISTSPLPVLHFPTIARAGGGQHVTLRDVGALVEELVLLSFGGPDRERIRAWMRAIDGLMAAEPGARPGSGPRGAGPGPPPR